MEIRDEYFHNRWQLLRLMGDQFKMLLGLAAVAVITFVALWWSPLENPDLLNLRLLWGVVLMGLLGGAFGSAKSLFTVAVKRTIPESMAEALITLVRSLL